MAVKLQRIGILTGGGDCPGLNAVIRSITKPAMSYYHSTVIGIQDGFEGLVEGSMRELSWLDVSGIIGLGGTILGTSTATGGSTPSSRSAATGRCTSHESSRSSG
jgi:6-phosphofructokinase